VEDDELLLLSSIEGHELPETLQISRTLDPQLPLVGTVDVRQPPQQYRILPDALPAHFEFTAGEPFTVSIIGQELADETVIGAVDDR
jgi:hypothetical protein